MRSSIFIILSIISFSMPFFEKDAVADKSGFSGWEKTFEGKAIKELELSSREKLFLTDFPGHVSRFSDGNKEIIMRWLKSETRKLHPSSDCFKGIGYKITPKPVEIDKNNIKWSTFIATKDNVSLKVKERIFDKSNNWTDTSSWYWSAILGKSNGPWTALTVVENL